MAISFFYVVLYLLFVSLLYFSETCLTASFLLPDFLVSG